MIDHVFMGALASLGQALDDVFLARTPHEDRLAADLFTGDVVWETSVSLPGEGEPPRVRADVTLEWSTWSQAAWRSWVLEEPMDEYPEINVEIVLRLQRVAGRPPVDTAVARLGDGEPAGMESFERVGVVVEEDVDTGHAALEVAYEGTLRLSDPEDAPRRNMWGPGGHPGTRPGGQTGGHTGGQPGGRPGPQADGPPGGQTGGQAAPAPSPGDQMRAPAAGGEAPLGPALCGHLQALSRWLASALVGLSDLEVEFLPPDTE
jgi:hypothetical protein